MSAAASSSGSAIGNAILEPAASLFLPIAGSTQEDLALFQEADAIFQQQEAEIDIDGHAGRHSDAEDDVDRIGSDPSRVSHKPRLRRTGPRRLRLNMCPPRFLTLFLCFLWMRTMVFRTQWRITFHRIRKRTFPLLRLTRFLTPTQVQHTPRVALTVVSLQKQ